MKLHVEPNLDDQLQVIDAVCDLFHGQELHRRPAEPGERNNRVRQGALQGSVRIPRQTGQRFHSKLDSDSTANWTAIPGQTGQSFVVT
jgi:hypothetical protein